AAAAAIAIAPGATLVFENTARDFAAPLAGGGALALVNARARLGAANALSALSLSAGARAQVAHASALGGAASAVTVAAGSVLELLSPATGTLAAAAGTLVVDGGKLVFGENTSLAATGSVSFKNHAAVALSGPLPTGRHTLVTGGAGIACDNPVTLLPDYAPSQAGLDVSLALEGKNLVMSVYNQSAGPAKDIAMARDTVLAALAAVYGRVSESLLAPLAEHAPRAPARDFWLKGFGSDGDYEQTPMQTGFTDRTCGVLAGYDRVFGQKLLLGAWAGLATGRLETSNAASAAADQQLFGAYSALKLGRWHIGADVAAGFTQADTARDEHAGAALGCYEAASLSASAELGFTLAAWARGAVRPAVSLHHTAMRYKNQMEKGPGAVIVPDFTHRFTQSFLRLAASQGFTLPWGAPAMLDVSAGWRHNLAGDRCRVALAYATDPSAPLQVEAAGCTRGAVVAGLGLRAEISKSMSFGLGYDHEVAAARARHSLNAIARWRW
ncbi:MAG: autotransporter outer membrane beta-barrel domain-containing protein, partial [Opitutaceae bacterium]|nr:autotransporter outer membrane beta-barrel domain-containing protein [Opitutaceae bacterium]